MAPYRGFACNGVTKAEMGFGREKGLATSVTVVPWASVVSIVFFHSLVVSVSSNVSSILG